MKKAILYCRVSSDEQAKGGSLKYQADALKRFCESNGIEVVDIYREDYSAKTFDRPEMKKICKKYLRKRKEVEADGLLVLRWSRFTRDASDGWDYISKFKKYGIEVNASEEHLDFEVAESKIMLSVYLSMAEVDNDKRSKATKDGIHQALADGKCVGMAPYGYANKRTGKHECWIEFDPKEAPFVTEAFHRVAYGVESPTVVWRDLRSRGMRVSESTFFRILRNRFYIGQVFVPEYGDSPEQYVKGKHQALTDAKSFYLVQDRLDGNRDKAEPEVKKVPDETFFMRSFLRCPHCGHTVYGSFSKGRNKRYAYYHCNYCGNYRIAAEDANDNMCRFLRSLKPSEAVMALYEAILVDMTREQEKVSKEERKKMKADLASMDAKMKKLQDKWFEGVIDDDSFTAMNSRLVAEKKDLGLRLEEANEQPMDKEMEEKMKFSLSFIENMGSCVATAPIHLKLNILGSIFSGKIVFENEAPRTATLSPLVSLIVGEPSVYKAHKTKQPSDSSESCSRGAMWGSNPRHPEPQSGALPTELIAPC